jgi:PPP family 3-phenylpropionic acid transporter
MAIEPVIDAAAIRMTRRRGTDFATVRIWGTFGYIAMTATAGLLFGWLGIAVFVPLFIATCLMRGAAALPLPFFRAPENAQSAVAPLALSPDTAMTLRQVFRPWFILTLAGTALLQASHMLMISFGALLWVRAGVPEAALGVLWIVAPVCEIVTMLFFSHFARRFSARHLLLAACIGGVIRWTGMAMATEIWQLALLQGLHMASFGLAYMGILNFIANWTDEKIAAEAQSFYVVLRQVASVAALLLFGSLVSRLGLESFYAGAAMAAAGAVMVFASLAIKDTKR